MDLKLLSQKFVLFFIAIPLLCSIGCTNSSFALLGRNTTTTVLPQTDFLIHQLSPGVNRTFFLSGGNNVGIEMLNRGETTVTLVSFAATASDGTYNNLPSTSCSAGTVLAPGQSCLLSIEFIASWYGDLPGSLDVTYSVDGKNEIFNLPLLNLSVGKPGERDRSHNHCAGVASSCPSSISGGGWIGLAS